MAKLTNAQALELLATKTAEGTKATQELTAMLSGMTTKPKNGTAPYLGENGNWWDVNGDTGIPVAIPAQSNMIERFSVKISLTDEDKRKINTDRTHVLMKGSMLADIEVGEKYNGYTVLEHNVMVENGRFQLSLTQGTHTFTLMKIEKNITDKHLYLPSENLEEIIGQPFTILIDPNTDYSQALNTNGENITIDTSKIPFEAQIGEYKFTNLYELISQESVTRARVSPQVWIGQKDLTEFIYNPEDYIAHRISLKTMLSNASENNGIYTTKATVADTEGMVVGLYINVSFDGKKKKYIFPLKKA